MSGAVEVSLCCVVHGKQYLVGTRQKNQLINARLVLSPVSYSGRGSKLLLRNKRPGDNSRQYGMYLACLATKYSNFLQLGNFYLAVAWL